MVKNERLGHSSFRVQGQLCRRKSLVGLLSIWDYWKGGWLYSTCRFRVWICRVRVKEIGIIKKKISKITEVNGYPLVPELVSC